MRALPRWCGLFLSMSHMQVYVVLPGNLVPANKADLHPAPALLTAIDRMLRRHYWLPAQGQGWGFANGARADLRYVVPLDQTLLGIRIIDPQRRWHATASGLDAQFPGRSAALCGLQPDSERRRDSVLLTEESS